MSVTEHSKYHWFFTRFHQPPREVPTSLTLDDPDLLHHIKTVMRLQRGDRIVLVNDAESQPYLCRLESFSGKRMTVTLLEKPVIRTEPGVPITAALGLLKGQRWDWMLQKLTEVGVSEILPLQAQRSVVDVKHPEAKHERWHQILKNAAEQSERVSIPVLYPPQTLEAFLETWAKKQEVLKWVASERSGRPLYEALSAASVPAGGVVFVIGPEGGWEEAELALLQAGGFQAISLGYKILRSETAALYLTTVIDYAIRQNPDATG